LLSGIIIVFLIARHQYSQRVATIWDIELIDVNKNKIKLSELKGSVLFINFWATWCESCVEELPAIEGLFRNLSENPKFKLITILYKDDRDRAFSYMKKNSYTFPLYLNPDGSAAKYFGITGVPETFIIDKKGVLRGKVIGPEDWNSPGALENFHALIDEP
jgi:thiol-disulfide isomerase/thioredoxin